MKDILIDIRQTLHDFGEPAFVSASARFFKEGEQPREYGVAKDILRKIGKELFNDIKGKPKKEVYALCQELWKSLYFEEAYIACIVTKRLYRQYEVRDIALFQKWLDHYVSNWASCDTLCTSTIGPFLLQFPQEVDRLSQWAKSTNRWMRRGAAVSLVVSAKKGLYLSQVFTIALLLMRDDDDLVQKGVGWMLKEASRLHEKEVFDFVVLHKVDLPRTTLRYAVEKMSLDLKRDAMLK